MSTATERAEATAYRQITKYGTTGTLTRKVVASISTAGAVTNGTALSDTLQCVFLPLSEYTDNLEERNSLAQRGVRYLAMAARDLSIEPRARDTVTIGSDVWDIQSSTPINPDGASPIAHCALVVKL